LNASGYQSNASLPAPLQSMADAERAFAARARVVGWKQAFLEYFADDAVGFDGETTGPARDQIRQLPDPPKDMQLLWEPRYGDTAASGELGYLTGPSTNINPARENGTPRYGTYASVWKRQADGSYKVVMDVGISTPSPAPFAPGFTRAPQGARYTGRDTPDAAARSLRAADAALTAAALRNRATAYRGRIGNGARLHYPNALPLAGEAAITAWLRTQPPWSAGGTLYAEAAQSADLGYSWGSYAAPAAGADPAQKGFYMRVWTRERSGAWKVVLDVLQPQ
jgi:ketosteroid isomerase-like protein